MKSLDGQTYHPSRSGCFVVKQSKFREVFATDFRDRVVHHVLVDVLERIWEPLFIHDSYACRKDKGTHRAVRRAACRSSYRLKGRHDLFGRFRAGP